MSINTTPYRIMVTHDYDTFKSLVQNRDVTDKRAKRIANSIESVGFVMQPILVNEKYEVIDGQGRLEALRRLDMPVYFIQQPGLTDAHCVAMNINQTNWTIPDYIKGYARSGVQSYKYLLEIIDGVGKDFPFSVVMYAFGSGWSNKENTIREGTFKCNKEDYQHVSEVLDWLKKFIPVLKEVRGRKHLYYNSLIFCYMDPNVDNSKLYKNMILHQADLLPAGTIVQAIRQIENIYNYRTRIKVYIETDYRKYIDNKRSFAEA